VKKKKGDKKRRRKVLGKVEKVDKTKRLTNQMIK
jgi:hypothetical protein